MKTYHGSCHCGQVRFEVRVEIKRVMQCNGSVCTKKGFLHHRVTPERFPLLSGADCLVLHQFGSKEAKHYFCKRCGVHPFGYPRAAPDQLTINVRCLDDFDLEKESFEVVHFDGRHWEEAVVDLYQHDYGKEE